MNMIFMDRKEPLYGRQTSVMRLEPFSIEVLKAILRHYKRDYSSEDLLALWALTGGVAKYVALLMDAGATDCDKMMDAAVSEDPFCRFWFRFIFKYDYMVQMNAFDLLRKIVKRDYPVFSGFALESYFRKKFSESGEWTKVGNWWDRKGENEIDLMAENELDGTRAVCEIKREKSRIDIGALKRKFAAFVKATGKWKRSEPDFIGLSLEDM